MSTYTRVTNFQKHFFGPPSITILIWSLQGLYSIAKMQVWQLTFMC